MPYHRRDFLKTTLAAGAGAVAAGRSAASARQGALTLFPGFETRKVSTSGATINLVRGGSGPPLLLVHGYPQTHVEWHKIAGRLAQKFTVVAPDLRGYGDSSRPSDGENHAGYSKRAMALDQVETMKALGYDRFAVVGHDRGARVTWRLAVEHPTSVSRAAVIDIVPRPYDSVTRDLAMQYFHWFFLTQPAPLPETLIGNSREFWFRRFLGGSYIAPEALAEYLRQFKDPATIHSTCEDYRAGATIDLQHADEDRRKVTCPLLVLWGERGTVGRLYDPIKIWREHATDVRGRALPGGHFLPEELPDQTLAELMPFLAG
jgi:haloacetate dehalogenase